MGHLKTFIVILGGYPQWIAIGYERKIKNHLFIYFKCCVTPLAPGITGIRLALASPHMGPYFGNTQTLNPTQNQIPTQHCLQV